MKATLKLNYPHFKAELLGVIGDLPSTEPPKGFKTLASYPYAGGALLHVYSQYKQTIAVEHVKESYTVSSDTAVLVIKGTVTAGDGQVAKALDYISPKKTAFSVKGKALLFLIR